MDKKTSKEELTRLSKMLMEGFALCAATLEHNLGILLPYTVIVERLPLEIQADPVVLSGVVVRAVAIDGAHIRIGRSDIDGSFPIMEMRGASWTDNDYPRTAGRHIKNTGRRRL
jgi:hypothetical protein